jgi:peroxiredoxin
MQAISKWYYALAALAVALGIAIFIVLRVVNPTSRTAATGDHYVQEPPTVAAGARAANFTLQSLAGGEISMAQLRGKVVFLNIWATWCGPCREEMPSMETLYDEFKSHKDFVMLAISQDERGRDVVAPYVAKNGYHFTVLLDPKNLVSTAYNVSGVPETFIIDRAGRIVAHHLGAFDWSRPDVKEALQQLLDSKAG